MEWVINATPRPLYPRERDPVAIVKEAGWAPGPVWTSAENLARTGIRSPDRPARSELLWRLSYPGLTVYLLLLRCNSDIVFHNNVLPFKAILDLFCPFSNFRVFQVISDIVLPSGLTWAFLLADL
jgi:hypothetical protein